MNGHRACPECGVAQELRRAIGGAEMRWVHVSNTPSELAAVEACLAAAARRAREERSEQIAAAVWRACDAAFAVAIRAQEGA